MSTFTVQAAAEKKRFDGKYGPSVVYNLKLSRNGSDEVEAEWLTKASTPPPEPGSTLEGELEQSEYGWKLKKAQSGSGGFSRSPRDSRRIERQHSQSVAVEYAKLMQAAGHEVPTTPDELRALITWFAQDVDR